MAYVLLKDVASLLLTEGPLICAQQKLPDGLRPREKKYAKKKSSHGLRKSWKQTTVMRKVEPSGIYFPEHLHAAAMPISDT